MLLVVTFLWMFSGIAVGAGGVACPHNQRAWLELTARVPANAGISAADLRGQVSGALDDAGLPLIDPDMADEALEARQRRLIAMGDAVGALNLAQEIKATLLVKALVKGSQRQIKGLAKGLYNTSVQIQLEALSTQTGDKVGSIHESYRKPGLGLDSQLPSLMDSLLPGMAERLVKELCRDAPALTVPETHSETPEAAATGAAQLDSL